MASVALDKQRNDALCPRGLFVSTGSPSKAAGLGLSPISTTSAKQTETPRKLKDQYTIDFLKSAAGGSGNNNEEEEDSENQQERDADTPLGLKRSDSWGSRAGFSPRPKKANNPARHPVQSASSIRALQVQEEEDEDDEGEEGEEGNGAPPEEETDAHKSDSFRLSNQSHHSVLERIQEVDDSDDSEEEEDQYDGDGEEAEDDALQLYKSFSGDLVVRYDAPARRAGSSHQAYDDDDDDVVRI